MGSISFEEEQLTKQSSAPMSSKKISILSSFVIKHGLAKTDKDAQKVLLVIAIIGIILTILFYILAFVPPQISVSQSVLNANNAKLLREAPAQ